MRARDSRQRPSAMVWEGCRQYLPRVYCLILVVLVASILAGCGSAATSAARPRETATPKGQVTRVSMLVPRSTAYTSFVDAPPSQPALPSAPGTSAAAFELINGESGGVYVAQNGDQTRAMASTTKMMTALVAVLDAPGGLDQRITVGTDIAALAGTGASVANLQPGDTLTLRELLYGLLLPSGDDAAIVIADGVAGSQANMVQRMNAEAQKLGLSHTHYANVHGLDAPGHYSSASDLVRLAQRVLQVPILAQVVRTAVYTLPATADHGAYYWVNTNDLLFAPVYPGVDGVKTGFTGAAGYCLVFAAQGPYGRLIGVVLGEPGYYTRFVDARALLDWGFALQARAHALRHLTP